MGSSYVSWSIELLQEEVKKAYSNCMKSCHPDATNPFLDDSSPKDHVFESKEHSPPQKLLKPNPIRLLKSGDLLVCRREAGEREKEMELKKDELLEKLEEGKKTVSGLKERTRKTSNGVRDIKGSDEKCSMEWAVVAAGSVGAAGLVAATLFVCYSKLSGKGNFNLNNRLKSLLMTAY